jgi:hypothetical protein
MIMAWAGSGAMCDQSAQGAARVGLVCAPDENSGFYRPAKRPNPRTPKRNTRVPEQLELELHFGDFLESQPLADL